MEFNKLPSRPIVKSSIGAQADWERWLYENHFQRLLDGDGLDWSLELSIDQLPDDDDRHGCRFVVTLQLGADVNIETFLKTGTIDREGDERMTTLIGERKVPLRMKPMVHHAKGEKEARELLVRILPELRETIASSRLREIKRSLIGRWIDEQGVFGSRSDEQNW